jgi:hypothetical protein
MSADDRQPDRPSPKPPRERRPPELFQIVIECRGEDEQRELYQRLRREGLKLRLLVL